MILFYKTHSFGDEVVDSWRSNAAFARSVATRCEEKRKQKALLALEKKFSKSGQEDVDVFLQQTIKSNKKKILHFFLALLIGIGVVYLTLLPFDMDNIVELFDAVNEEGITSSLHGFGLFILAIISGAATLVSIVSFTRLTTLDKENKLCKEIVKQRRLDGFLG